MIQKITLAQKTFVSYHILANSMPGVSKMYTFSKEKKIKRLVTNNSFM